MEELKEIESMQLIVQVIMIIFSIIILFIVLYYCCKSVDIHTSCSNIAFHFFLFQGY